MTMDREEMTDKVIATIEKESGKPLTYWVQLIKDSKLTKHSEIRNFFMKKSNLSYGYANTLTHRVRDILEGTVSSDELVDAQYTGKKAHLKPIYDKLIAAVKNFGPEIEISPKRAYVSVRRRKQFAIIQPSTTTRIDLGINLKDTPSTLRLESSGKWNTMVSHRVRLTQPQEVDTELIAWLKAAYELAQ